MAHPSQAAAAPTIACSDAKRVSSKFFQVPRKKRTSRRRSAPSEMKQCISRLLHSTRRCTSRAHFVFQIEVYGFPIEEIKVEENVPAQGALANE